MDDKVKVCDDCLLSGDHQGHKIKQLAKIKQESNERKNQLSEAMQVLVKYDTEIDVVVEKERAILNGSIKERFQEIRKRLFMTEIDLMHTVTSFVDVEKQRAHEGYGVQSELGKEFNRKIENQKNILASENMFDLIEEDVKESSTLR